MRIKVEHDNDGDLDGLKKELEGTIRHALIFAPDVELVEPGTLAPTGSMKTKLVAR